MSSTQERSDAVPIPTVAEMPLETLPARPSEGDTVQELAMNPSEVLHVAEPADAVCSISTGGYSSLGRCLVAAMLSGRTTRPATSLK
ncbi:hypothetical protein FKM82_020120 [Ascaphus truei]